MKLWTILALLSALFAAQTALTQDMNFENFQPGGALPATILKPLSPQPEAQTPDSNTRRPSPPPRDPNGMPMTAVENSDLPAGEVMNDLTDPSIFKPIQKLNRTEMKRGAYHWHAASIWNYCHYRDRAGNHWVGWKTGSVFHWVLDRGNRFWWLESGTGRWLYFYGGYWWWPGGADHGQVQVYLNGGHYYLCGPDGSVGLDMGPTGETANVSNPVSLQGFQSLPVDTDDRPESHRGHHGQDNPNTPTTNP